MPERSCGDCIACCVYLRISALDKPGMKHCKHLTLPGEPTENSVFYTGATTTGNCGVYTSRPECCVEYACMWKQGHGAEEDRPDRSLMLFDDIKGIPNSVQAKPLKDGQEDTHTGRMAIDRMSQSTGVPVLVLSFYERRLQRVVGRGV